MMAEIVWRLQDAAERALLERLQLPRDAWRDIALGSAHLPTLGVLGTAQGHGHLAAARLDACGRVRVRIDRIDDTVTA